MLEFLMSLDRGALSLVLLFTAMWAAGGAHVLVSYARRGRHAFDATSVRANEARLGGDVGFYAPPVGHAYTCLSERGIDVLLVGGRSGWGPLGRRTLHLRVVGTPPGLEVVSPGRERHPVQTGDAEFDNRVRLVGDPVLAVSLMSYPVRQGLRDLVKLGARIDDRMLLCPLPSPPRASTVRKRARRMVDTCIALDEARRAGTVGSLAALVREDPERGVRATALSMLKTHSTGGRALGRELARLGRQLRGEDRMELAVIAQDAGLYRDIAEDVHEAGALRAEGLVQAAAVEGRMDSRMVRLAFEFLDAPSATLRIAAMQAAVVPGGERLIEAVREWIREAMLARTGASAWMRDDHGVGLGAGFDVIAVHGDWADVPLLLKVLPELGHVGFRRCLLALEVHGTIEEVPALLEIAEASDRSRAEEVRACIRQIQAGVATEAGALTVSPHRDSGALTVSSDQAGRLAMVEPEDGRETS